MSADPVPYLVEVEGMKPLLGRPGLLVADLSSANTHQQMHIPGSVFIDYSWILAERKPVMGLLPDTDRLEQLFSSLGIDQQTHVIAYDDEGGGKAGRLLWTLEVMGHSRHSLLNGGLHAWANEGHPLSRAFTQPEPTRFTASVTMDPVADADYIMANLHREDLVLLDVRSPEEYRGVKRFADRAGHIPGAVNLEWTQGMDQSRNLRIGPDARLLERLAQLGVTRDKEVITYCQTHHRSSFSYVMLKALGFERVRGYPGSWSDWGNRADTPVE